MGIEKDYNQSEFGILPKDWQVCRLGELGENLIGLTYNPKDVKEFGTLVLRSSNIQNGRLKYLDNIYVEMELPKRVIVKRGDILICVRNGSKQLIGKCALIDSKAEGSAFGAFMAVYRSDLNNFIIHQFRSEIIQKQINEVMGATINQITNKDLLGFRIPLPPDKKEQIAICTALSDMDSLVSSLEQLIAKKRNVKQCAMQQMLRPQKDWEIKTYGEVFDFLTTATYSRADLNSEEEVGYVHYGDVHTKWHYFLDIAKNKLPSINNSQAKNYTCLKDGDIIMADASEDYSGIGKSVEVKNLNGRKVISGLHTFLLRDDKGIFVNGYKGYLHASSFIKNQFDKLATGMKVYGVSKKNLKSVLISIPPKSEQRRISDILSNMAAEISSLESQLEKYRLIKQGMLQTLLTGKIRLI